MARPSVSLMLYSTSTAVAFAHYPKTAGSSLTAWFTSVLPDAREVAPGDPHIGVHDALVRAGLVAQRARTRLGRLRFKLAREATRLLTGRRLTPPEVVTRPETRIIGVIREPFEMLVSLYEYWRRYPFAVEPTQPLIRKARTGTFREFAALAVDERQLPDYGHFFDVGGPLWRNTRLLDFASLEPALMQVCDELGIAPPPRLDKLNAAPKRAYDLGAYRAEAGPLVFRIRSYFAWYYDEGIRVMLRGDRAGRDLGRRAA